MNKKIYVTQPYLPPLDEFLPYLEQIWSNKILTNSGPFHQQLEEELKEFLGVKYISLFSNATIALIIALRALNVRGDVITTPFSFVATAHSLLWSGINPIFVDINPDTLNIDIEQIEKAITPKTTAILPVHVYGRPCDVNGIKKIADHHGLKVVYDAAHAFGVKYHSNSILNHGDLSVLSFHATKVFNTFEGGAIICHTAEMKQHIDFLKNFGFLDEITVKELGINGKMSEINAAFGLLQLKYFDDILKKRENIANFYNQELSNIKGIKLLMPIANTVSNNSYFPILIEENHPLTRDELYLKLKEKNIFSRRYFYPLITSFPMYENNIINSNLLPVALEISNHVICLPIYPNLEEKDQKLIIDIIKSLS